jgi:hypothetical protein
LRRRREATMMACTMRWIPLKFSLAALIVAGSTAASAGAGGAHVETFVIPASQDGHEATIKIPVGAITTFSATAAEALVNYRDPDVEAMRLRGNVLINVISKRQSIEIKAQSVVLELTADESTGWTAWLHPSSYWRRHSAEFTEDADDIQTFVGNVYFSVPTSFGAMKITADRLEHSVEPTAGS